MQLLKNMRRVGTDRWTDKSHQTIAVTLCLHFVARINKYRCKEEAKLLRLASSMRVFNSVLTISCICG